MPPDNNLIKMLLEHIVNIETWFETAGPGVKTIGVCLLLGYFLKSFLIKAHLDEEKRWNKRLASFIPIFVVITAILIFPHFSSPGIVDPGLSRPMRVLMINGFFYGLAAWAFHNVVLRGTLDKWLYKKDKEGNTTFLKSEPSNDNKK